jgi:hypothetical protein
MKKSLRAKLTIHHYMYIWQNCPSIRTCFLNSISFILGHDKSFSPPVCWRIVVGFLPWFGHNYSAFFSHWLQWIVWLFMLWIRFQLNQCNVKVRNYTCLMQMLYIFLKVSSTLIYLFHGSFFEGQYNKPAINK